MNFMVVPFFSMKKKCNLGSSSGKQWQIFPKKRDSGPLRHDRGAKQCVSWACYPLLYAQDEYRCCCCDFSNITAGKKDVVVVGCDGTNTQWASIGKTQNK